MPNQFRAEFIEALQAAREADLEMAFLREMIRSLPGLFWAKWQTKDGEYKMIAVSRDYASLYLGNKNTLLYEGKTDASIWGKETATAFKENDDRAVNHGKPVWVEEPITSPISGVSGRFVGWKWPAQIDDHTIVCGMGEHVHE